MRVSCSRPEFHGIGARLDPCRGTRRSGPPLRQRLACRRGGNEDRGWPCKISAGSASRSGSARTRCRSKLARIAYRLPARIHKRRIVLCCGKDDLIAIPDGGGGLSCPILTSLRPLVVTPYDRFHKSGNSSRRRLSPCLWRSLAADNQCGESGAEESARCLHHAVRKAAMAARHNVLGDLKEPDDPD